MQNISIMQQTTKSRFEIARPDASKVCHAMFDVGGRDKEIAIDVVQKAIVGVGLAGVRG
jgi:hypothetical protein